MKILVGYLYFKAAARDNALNILNSIFTEKLLSLGLKGLKE